METKEIEQILSDIGITEETCEITSTNGDYGGCEMYIGYYHELVETIQKFMEYLYRENHKLLLPFKIEEAKKDVINISKRTPYAGSMLEMDLHLAEEYLEYLQAEQKEQMEEELRKLTDNRLD